MGLPWANVQSFVRKFLLSIFVVTDDLQFTINDFHDRSINSKNYKLIYVAIALFWCLCIFACVKTLPNLTKAYTTFNITAKTELVYFKLQEHSNVVWWIEDVEMMHSCSSHSEGQTSFKYSGRLIFKKDTAITIKRLANDSALITVRGKRKAPILEAWENEDEMSFEAIECLDIRIDKIRQRRQNGQTFVFPISGEIVAGGDISFRKNDGYLLESGRVYILDKGILIKHFYSVGPFELNTGDKFIIENSIVDSSGFVSINSEPLMTVVYNAQGSKGLIQRYMSENYEISNSIWSRLYHDQTLVYLWACVLLVYSAIKVFIRFQIEKE